VGYWKGEGVNLRLSCTQGCIVAWRWELERGGSGVIWMRKVLVNHCDSGIFADFEERDSVKSCIEISWKLCRSDCKWRCF
jgi:hypothetical protein